MRPQFSVVSAVYNVSEYIEAFLASLDRQTYGTEGIEVVLVDDGSTDGSGEIAERWAASTSARVRVLHQENAGQGAARNAGIEVATGHWVTFADPDDVLADDYFAQVAAFLESQTTRPHLVATRQLVFSEDHLDHQDTHPLRRRFNRNELVDLRRYPNRIHLSGCSAFFPLDELNTAGIRFDIRIRPTFEDGHLVGRQLLAAPAPLVGFVRTAEYYYRKRVDGTSSVQSAWGRPDKYTDVPRYGYLDLLERAADKHGQPPVWVQNTVLYDLQWYFRADSRMTSATGAMPDEVLDEFHALCHRIFALIDVETILGFRIVPTPHRLRLDLVAGYKDVTMRPEHVRLDALDQRQRLVRARYVYSGPAPEEAYFWRGRPVSAVHGKTRSIEYFGRALAHERIVWLPADGTLRMTLDGRPVPLATRGPSDLPYQVTAARLVQDLAGGRRVTPPRRLSRKRRLFNTVTAPLRRVAALAAWVRGLVDHDRWTARLSKRLAASAWGQRRFGGAWVLMDRQDQAQDNAEHLYRWLAAERRDVNAWFVLDRRSRDWDRLRREGFRLVPYGSLRWRALLLDARHVVSSHANAFVISPLRASLYGRPNWQFTFLQHGVGKDDYSRWLNDKRIHVLVTTTEAEERSFSGDGTPYVFTTKEVQRTGLPRHDALLARARALDPRRVDRILVMPTWRRSLAEGMPASFTAEQRAAAFAESDYARHWFGLLGSPELRRVAERTGSRVSLLPHPNMAEFLRGADLPGHVELLDWRDVDVQDVFAGTRLLLTDYSSIAFEIAFLGRPTVYYQFDREAFFSGAQPYRRGYFSYERDGFGPVVGTHEDVVGAVEALADRGFVPDDEVAARIETTFGERTGDSCSRVYQAIVALDRPRRAQPLDGDPAGMATTATAAADALAAAEDRSAADDRAADELAVDALLAATLGGSALDTPAELEPSLEADLAQVVLGTELADADEGR